MFAISRYICVLSIVLAANFGCSKGVSLKTVQVSGKVTLDGQALPGASVVFHGEIPSGAIAPPAPGTGITGTDGTYTLSTLASGAQIVSGVPPGSYKVTITKQAGAIAGSGMSTMTPEEYAKSASNMSPEEAAKQGGTSVKPGEAMVAPKSDIPARYASPDDSGFTATVQASGAQKFDFALTSK